MSSTPYQRKVVMAAAVSAEALAADVSSPAKPAPAAQGAESSTTRYIKFAAGVAGIFFFYGAVYAEAQRELTSLQPLAGSETKQTRFTNTAFVMMVQCLGNALFSVVMHFLTVYVLGVWTRKESQDRVAKRVAKEAEELALKAKEDEGKRFSVERTRKLKKSFWGVLLSWDAIKVSLGYVFAMYSSNKALEFVSFPLQILAKSCKMIPVLLGDVLITGKRRNAQEYLGVVLMTAGVIYFSFLDGGSGKKGHGKGGAGAMDASNQMLGYMLLAGSLALDGVSGPLQQQMGEYALTSFQQNLVSNAWAIVYMAVVVVLNNEWTSSFEYLRLHPAVVGHLFWFTVASACGQAFIFYVIIEFGALANTQVTTLRKLFSVVFTEVFRPQPGSSGLKMSQWMCVLLIFVGVYFGETGKTHAEPAKAAPAVTSGSSAQEAQKAESK